MQTVLARTKTHKRMFQTSGQWGQSSNIKLYNIIDGKDLTHIHFKDDENKIQRGQGAWNISNRQLVAWRDQDLPSLTAHYLSHVIIAT